MFFFGVGGEKEIDKGKKSREEERSEEAVKGKVQREARAKRRAKRKENGRFWSGGDFRVAGTHVWHIKWRSVPKTTNKSSHLFICSDSVVFGRGLLAFEIGCFWRGNQ